jgi:hypothetical protein
MRGCIGCAAFALALLELGACGPPGARIEAPLVESYGWQTPGRGIELDAAAVLRGGDDGDGLCRAARIPWRGPALCGPGSLLRPERGSCSVFADMTPRLDPIHGFYRADRDRKNWVPTGRPDVLEVLAVYVQDNGEGEDPPHGPYGNLYWDVFGAFEPLMTSRDGADKRRVAAPHQLRGPHRTHGTTDEWIDDEVLTYSKAGLFRWGSAPGTNDAVVIRVYESDGAEDGFLFRRNDVLGMETVRRRDTAQPCGQWVAFHRYTNGHPRRRTQEAGLWMLLRTPAPPVSFGVLDQLERGL